MTNDAPERIWVWRNAPHGELVVSGPDVPRLTVSSEYIRKDLSDAEVIEAAEALADEYESLIMNVARLGEFNLDQDLDALAAFRQAQALAALEEKNDDE